MASLSTWSEAGIGIVLFLLAFGIVIVNMNVMYHQSNDASLGMNATGAFGGWTSYQSTIESGMQGEASTNAITGVSLGTTWGMIKGGLSIAFSFVTGGWIEAVIGLLGWGLMGTYLALALRLLFVLSLGFILLRLILKVNP